LNGRDLQVSEGCKGMSAVLGYSMNGEAMEVTRLKYKVVSVVSNKAKGG